MASAFPTLVRWPGVITPGTIFNDIFSQEDWLPTLLAAAGDPNIVEEMKKGYQVNGKTWKVHLIGTTSYHTSRARPRKARREDSLLRQGGELNAVRWNDWKVHFAVTNGNIASATREVPGWPVIVNLRADPYEKAPHESGLYFSPGRRITSGSSSRFRKSSKRFLTTLPEYPFQREAA